tara:strand:+ start:255 stop:509 length:255 start_codon:yes stop_codon:yes gene_type:complete
MELNLASQTQKVPHVGCPHKDPVTIAIKLNERPIGAKLLKIIIVFLNLNKKLKIHIKLIKLNIISANHADGTWTYIILTESPCM